jgi:hypothetical protein
MGLIWLLVLAGIGAVAYFAVKGRMIRLREEIEAQFRKANQRRASTLPSESMSKCATCGTYLAPAQQKNCGKTGCPYR